jgi:hypothetical protein
VPITITPLGPGGFFGPGISLNLSTDFIGPFPTGTQWLLHVGNDPEFRQNMLTYGFPWTKTAQVVTPITEVQSTVDSTLGDGAVAGSSIHIEAQILEPPATVVDSGSTTLKWDPTSGLPQVIQALQSGTVQGGFTETDRQTIDTTQQISQAIQAGIQVAMQLGGTLVNIPVGQVLTSHLLNFLQDRNLSGGVTCLPVRYDASLNALYGVTVRIDSWPAEVMFRTPDGQYSFKDLAVLQIWRGGALLERHGIHTTSHTVSPLPGLPFPWLTAFAAPLQPPDYHIFVDWLDGVCGELIGQALP